MATQAKKPKVSDGARPAKPGLHPRNRHAAGYDFPRLVADYPGLGPFLRRNPYGNDTVDFTDPEAVKALNRALLQVVYGIHGWDLPPGALCPPIPGRADYLHHLADLLASSHGGIIPRGPAIRLLDIGVGASAIYPLLGQREYGWSFVGTDSDAAALASAAHILEVNGDLVRGITLRRQSDPKRIFEGIIDSGECFDATLCNPPFYRSAREAREATEQKWRKLGRSGSHRNFGGAGAELWCEGGEAAFISRMIQESRIFADRVAWFTTLVSASSHLPTVHGALRRAEVREIRTLPMAQGQKQSRVIAWSFLEAEAMRSWAKARWQPAGEAR